MSATARSGIYTGRVRHRRFAPVHHEFSYQVAMPLLFLDELGPGDAAGRLLARLPTAANRYERGDYLGPPEKPLDQAVRDLVEAEAGFRPTGRIALLANLRTAGYNFNPIALYFCFGAGDDLDAVAFEVTSTPWGERHAYVAVPGAGEAVRRFSIVKALHVSPFLPMELEYRFSCGVPGNRLDVRIEVVHDGRRVFDADLWCRRRQRRAGVALLLVRLGPLEAIAAIYLQAARLAARGAPFYRSPSLHPDEHRAEPGTAGGAEGRAA